MRRFRVGPGALVTAAFIGPGTVTTCTLAGVRFGYALLWALVFATIGTIVLQEMSARLGTVAGVGLGDAIRQRFAGSLPRMLATGLIAAAIGIGNAAYQTGNLLGAALGGQIIVGGDLRWGVAALAALASALLWTGSYRTLERVLVALVILMSVVFIATAVSVATDPGAIAEGLWRVRLPPDASLVALGLVGTTIVPYNLFLHASAARQRFHGPDALFEARADLVVAIALGGIVSMTIVIAAAASGAEDLDSMSAMAAQLEPLLGRWARDFFGLGLLAAGLTSAITAPMAAAYALAGAFGWPADLTDSRLRMVWGGVMATGLAFGLAGMRPVPAIVFAQAANGLLLPAVAAFLLLVMNDRKLLGDNVNGAPANVLGALVTAATLVLGARALAGALGM